MIEGADSRSFENKSGLEPPSGAGLQRRHRESRDYRSLADAVGCDASLLSCSLLGRLDKSTLQVIADFFMRRPAPALAVSGGKIYAAPINGVYEDTGQLHNDRTVYSNVANPAWKLMYCKGSIDIFENYVNSEVEDTGSGAAEVEGRRPKMYTPEEHVGASALRPSIEAVLQQVHPQAVLGAGAVRMMEGRVLARSLEAIAARTKTDEVGPASVADLEAAVKASIPGQLATYGITEMHNAVEKYTSGNATGALVFDSATVVQVAESMTNGRKLELQKVAGARIAAAALMAFLCAEVLELAGNAANDRVRERRNRGEQGDYDGPSGHPVPALHPATRWSTNGKAPRKQLTSLAKPVRSPKPWESAWDDLKMRLRELESKQAKVAALVHEEGRDGDVTTILGSDILAACFCDEEIRTFMIATEEEGDLDADAEQMRRDEDEAQSKLKDELTDAAETWENEEWQREELRCREDAEEACPRLKMERLLKRYTGWVFTQGKLASYKNFGSNLQLWSGECRAYMRSVDVHSSKKQVDGAKVDLRDGSVCASVLETPYVSPLEVCQWEVFCTDGENPKTIGFDWGESSTWSKYRDDEDAEPPQFRPQKEVALTMATEQELEDGRGTARQAGQRLAAVQVKVCSASEGSKVNLPEVMVSEPSRKYGTFLALPGILHNDRPVYECTNTTRMSGQPYNSLSYKDYGTRNLQLRFDKGEWRCDGNDNNTTLWSIFANGAATPLEVPAGCWEYDDGHFASWGAGRVSVLPKE
jgi:hypothetical protein